MINKAVFYDILKVYAKMRHIPIRMRMRFAEHYSLYFEWMSENPDGSFNPMMYAQLIDENLQGAKKYVVPDLFWDSQKEGTTTDYKLYRYLDKWVTEALKGTAADGN